MYTPVSVRLVSLVVVSIFHLIGSIMWCCSCYEHTSKQYNIKEIVTTSDGLPYALSTLQIGRGPSLSLFHCSICVGFCDKSEHNIQLKWFRVFIFWFQLSWRQFDFYNVYTAQIHTYIQMERAIENAFKRSCCVSHLLFAMNKQICSVRTMFVFVCLLACLLKLLVRFSVTVINNSLSFFSFCIYYGVWERIMRRIYEAQHVLSGCLF